VAFDSTASGIVVLEESLTVSRCNLRAAELCGTTIPKLLGRRFRDALIGAREGAAATAVDGFIARALADGGPRRDVVRDEVAGRLFSLIATPHPDGGCVITFDDVTDSHRLAERHRKVLDTVSDAIVITDLAHRITFANPAAQGLFQQTSLEGESMLSLTAADWIEYVKSSEQRARNGDGQPYEYELLRADGERRMVRVTSAPLVELGRVTGTVACLHDITHCQAESRVRLVG
jgi:PAS domain S-box-containing protein